MCGYSHIKLGERSKATQLSIGEKMLALLRVCNLVPFYPAGHFQFGLALDLFVHEHVRCMIFR